MKLANVSQRFSKTPIEGWDAVAGVWDAAIAKGKFVVFDRFISDRNFGQRKRNFIVGGAGIPSGYDVVRIPNGQIYLLESKNVDLGESGNDVSSHVYMFHEAPITVDIVRLTPGPTRASGAAGDPTPTTVATVHADMERYSFSSGEVMQDRVGVFNLYLPKSTDVTLTDIIKVGTVEYSIQGKSDQLLLGYLRIVKRDST